MISVELIEDILTPPASRAWNTITKTLYNNFSQSLPDSSVQEIIKREKNIYNLETLISGAAWELWNSFEECVPKTSQLILDFWNKNLNGKAIFIIDGLSLREMPFFLDEGKRRGYSVHQSKISASALPSDTTYFSRSLGFSQRSILENNGAGTNHLLKNVVTDVSDLPWKDCLQLIGTDPNLLFWHTWFDDRIHEYKIPGKGLRDLSQKSKEHFTSDEFWNLIDKLTHGRRLVITSDHGYASTADFINISGEQGEYLKKTYKSQRYAKNTEVRRYSIPPLDIELTSKSGNFQYVLGKRKWKNSGGYPTLIHGGLSLMETMVPFIEISK